MLDPPLNSPQSLALLTYNLSSLRHTLEIGLMSSPYLRLYQNTQLRYSCIQAHLLFWTAGAHYFGHPAFKLCAIGFASCRLHDTFRLAFQVTGQLPPSEFFSNRNLQAPWKGPIPRQMKPGTLPALSAR
jgi:hypothetical protein